MTKDQHAALEQVARGWLVSQNRYWTDVAGVKRVNESEIPALVALLAAQRAAGLEEVANEMARHPYWSKEAEVWIKHLRQQAQEPRP